MQYFYKLLCIIYKPCQARVVIETKTENLLKEVSDPKEFLVYIQNGLKKNVIEDIRLLRLGLDKKIAKNREHLPEEMRCKSFVTQGGIKNYTANMLRPLSKPIIIRRNIKNVCFFDASIQYIFSLPWIFLMLTENYVKNDFAALFLDFYLDAVESEISCDKSLTSRKAFVNDHKMTIDSLNIVQIDKFLERCKNLYYLLTNDCDQICFYQNSSLNMINLILSLLLKNYSAVSTIDPELLKRYAYSDIAANEQIQSPLMPYLHLKPKYDVNTDYNALIIYSADPNVYKIELQKMITKIEKGDRKGSKDCVFNFDEVVKVNPDLLQIMIHKDNYGPTGVPSIEVSNIPLNLTIGEENYKLMAFTCTDWTTTNRTKEIHAWTFSRYGDRFYCCDNSIVTQKTNNEVLDALSKCADYLMYAKSSLI